MKQMARWVVSTAFLVVATFANAAPIVVDDNYWLQPKDFVNLSWNDINSACDASSGICNGFLGTTDVTGYTWASVDDMNQLFNFIVGNSAMGPGPSRREYAFDTIIPLFEAAGFAPTLTSLFTPYGLFGLTRETTQGSLGEGDRRGWMGQVEARCFTCYGLSPPPQDFDATSTFNYDDPVNRSNSITGAWLYRVPAPASTALLGLGLAALGFSRRNRAI